MEQSLNAINVKIASQNIGAEVCEACGAKFSTVERLIEHAQTHFVSMPKVSGTEQSEKCPHCGDRFGITELPSHVRNDHFIF